MPATHLQEQFQDFDQQTHAAELGMWVFMASEALFFAGLFALYGAYRLEFGHAFAVAAQHTDRALGTANTFILLTSSVVVALAVHAVREDRGRTAARWLWLAIGLGVLFLGLKGLEYAHHFREGLFPGPSYSNKELTGRAPHVFFNLYYAMTGLHAIHVAVGLLLLGWVSWLARTNRVNARYRTPLELCGIYWHFVDIVWVFLWPMFYLMRS
jgi:cytochrome c oxidase subunit 3